MTAIVKASGAAPRIASGMHLNHIPIVESIVKVIAQISKGSMTSIVKASGAAPQIASGMPLKAHTYS